MTFQNPYQTALQVDPAKEQAVLAKLKTDPQRLAELGLAPNEDFSALKNDPVKYNKVLSYVKGETYKSPAYAALGEGRTSPEFVQSQTQNEYGQTPTEYRSSIRPGLKTQYGADEVKNEQVLNKVGAENDQAINKYVDDMNKYIRGEVGRDVYINALNNLSSAAGTLSQTKTGFDNAYKRYQEAENAAVSGYSENRTEKRAAAEDMYKASKDLLDQSIADERKYEEARGNIYNPRSGKFERKPGGKDDSAEIKAFQGDAANWIEKLDNPDATKRVSWGTAFDSLKAKYPQASDEKINEILGGGVKYTPEKGFDPTTAYGRAKR